MEKLSNFNLSQMTASDNVKFKGANRYKYVETVAKDVIKPERYWDENLHVVAGILNQKTSNIMKMVEGASTERLYFLRHLADKYNANNYYLSELHSKEDSKIVNKIFEVVTKPTKHHTNAVTDLKCSFSDLHDIFVLTKDNPKELNILLSLQRGINASSSKYGKPRSELYLELLQSPNRSEYLKNLPEYESYLILNARDENAIKNLDKMLENGTYNASNYDKKLDTNHIFASNIAKETPLFNRSTLMENYSEEGNELLTTFIENFGISERSLKAGNDKDLLEMYKSTTKDNLNIRMDLLGLYGGFSHTNLQLTDINQNLVELNKLFKTIDNDKNAKKFVLKTLKNNRHLTNVKEYNDLFENIPTAKLNIFYKNALNIAQQEEGKLRIKYMQEELENPFFQTEAYQDRLQNSIDYGFIKKTSMLKKVGMFFENLYNKYQYKKVLKNEAKMMEKIKPETEFVQETPIVQETYNKASVIENPITPSVVEQVPENIELVVVKPVVENMESTVVATPKRIKKLFKPVVKKAPDAKKLAVINDVNGIIEKKLGSKTLSEQKREYAISASKMRLQMLPEIFDSIKETRAAKRAAGEKVNVSNKDALELYELIKGRNKKLVNYMLKKRNADGTRKFDIKEIIQTVNSAESKINKAKYSSPKTYKSSDAKAYYSELLENKIAEYGKLDKKVKNKI